MVVAFDETGGGPIRRSQLVLDHLVRSVATIRGFPKDLAVQTRTLPLPPTSFRRSMDRILARRPELLIFLTETHGDDLRLERVALNRRQSPDGGLLDPKPLVDGAPVAYFSPFGLEAARKAVARSGVVVELSSHPPGCAGNAAHFLALHRLAKMAEDDPIQVALIGIPIRSRAVSLQDATRGVASLLRFFAGAGAARASRAQQARRGPGSKPVAGRKA